MRLGVDIKRRTQRRQRGEMQKEGNEARREKRYGKEEKDGNRRGDEEKRRGKNGRRSGRKEEMRAKGNGYQKDTMQGKLQKYDIGGHEGNKQRGRTYEKETEGKETQTNSS